MKSFTTSFILVYRFYIKIYLNERPFEPRERDYALLFYVFAIWIGFGVPHTKVLKIYSPKNCSTSNLPPAYLQLCFNGFKLDDHDRWEIHGVSYGKAYFIF
jgi:hypothetical protein